MSSPYDFIFIGLKPDRKTLEEKIYKRLIARLPGMIREIKKLHAEGLSWKRMHALGLEYRFIALYLQDKLSKQETIEELFKEIKKYAKRQWQWFKMNKEIRWFKSDEFKAIEKYARMSLETGD